MDTRKAPQPSKFNNTPRHQGILKGTLLASTANPTYPFHKISSVYLRVPMILVGHLRTYVPTYLPIYLITLGIHPGGIWTATKLHLLSTQRHHRGAPPPPRKRDNAHVFAPPIAVHHPTIPQILTSQHVTLPHKTHLSVKTTCFCKKNTCIYGNTYFHPTSMRICNKGVFSSKKLKPRQ